MTVNEFFDFLIPILSVVFLIVLIVLGTQVTLILIRVKRMVERAETISDVASWVGIFKKIVSKRSLNNEVH